jgi:hypothetical protein
MAASGRGFACRLSLVALRLRAPGRPTHGLRHPYKARGWRIGSECLAAAWLAEGVTCTPDITVPKAGTLGADGAYRVELAFEPIGEICVLVKATRPDETEGLVEARDSAAVVLRDGTRDSLKIDLTLP